jgi:tetrahydromethanopterin S-methyltransferase subunit G
VFSDLELPGICGNYLETVQTQLLGRRNFTFSSDIGITHGATIGIIVTQSIVGG